jgi:4-aminobutyrate aminotransferase/(S)-3-amino-2-methylpropionate transaminase
MGDPVRVLLMKSILGEIRDKHLLENVQITGKYLKEGLLELQDKHAALLSNVRGLGTFLAFDLPTAQSRDQLIHTLRQKGTCVVVCRRVSSCVVVCRRVSSCVVC